MSQNTIFIPAGVSIGVELGEPDGCNDVGRGNLMLNCSAKIAKHAMMIAIAPQYSIEEGAEDALTSLLLEDPGPEPRLAWLLRGVEGSGSWFSLSTSESSSTGGSLTGGLLLSSFGFLVLVIEGSSNYDEIG